MMAHAEGCAVDRGPCAAERMLPSARPAMTDTVHGLWQALSPALEPAQVFWSARSARRHQLTSVTDRTAAIGAGDILAFCCLRNEAERLPYFLAHHRRLGVRHF